MAPDQGTSRTVRRIGFFHWGGSDRSDPIGDLEAAFSSRRLPEVEDGLIVLPEAFNVRGGYYYTTNEPHLVPRALERLQTVSAASNVVFVAGLIERVGGYNSAFLIDADAIPVRLSCKRHCGRPQLYAGCSKNNAIAHLHRCIAVAALICADARLTSEERNGTLEMMAALSSDGRILCVPACTADMDLVGIADRALEAAAAQAIATEARALLPAPAPDETAQVVWVQAGTLRDSHLEVAALFKEVQGDVRICDPYYGTRSLLRLDALVHCKSIRFLTLRADNKEQSFIQTALTEFVGQHPHVEFRKASSPDLHDRYLLTDVEVIILGHGLKDVGKKESFVIRLAKDVCGDLIEMLRQSFDARWAIATSL